MFKYTRKAVTFTTILGVGGLGLYFATGRDARASAQKYALGPAVRAVLDGEQAHKFTIEVFKYPNLAPRIPADWDQTHDPEKALEVTLFQHSANKKVKPLTLQNPVGIAAGFDKNGEAIDTLYNLGFSWVEIGSITPLPQPGNPKPRVFRLERDNAVINRYGFNSDGHIAVVARLKMRESELPSNATNFAGLPNRVLGVNLGKNKTGDEVQDYIKGVDTFGPHADVLIVNVSSPNTPGLRDLQSEEKLTNLLQTLVARRDSLPLESLPPIVVKIAPDLTSPEIESIAAAVKASKVDGVIVSNTTVQRPKTLRSGSELTTQVGGLSGAPVKPYSIQALKTLRKELGKDVTIIGCGGISDGADALEFARAGADFVQLYTSLVYKGPGVAAEVKEGIIDGLNGKKWTDVVGTDL
ncbi:uncharacterized protein SAPINGB_P005554 [Magnusiomyces paraingens]|uniref:Dihydroorotate dehydrogenase (quinone), mitochondrial n=1 Tax=Magnusiomyces paraingens TaxID=2606893 RepID=A0A5E8C2C9_9ASCO|nr:uncharacterized protein SAPINGB_P005554 [Saprochaete ingens]VVT57140.1 unnamed protein product [Saprochaete ingens]